MSVLHISEEEMGKDISRVLDHVAAGEEVEVDRPGGVVRLAKSGPIRFRTLEEALSRLDPDSPDGMDEGFANDVTSYRSNHRKELEEKPRMRTVDEMLAILRSLPGERGVMDEEFARDVRSFRERHPEGLDGSKWD